MKRNAVDVADLHKELESLKCRKTLVVNHLKDLRKTQESLQNEMASHISGLEEIGLMSVAPNLFPVKEQQYSSPVSEEVVPAPLLRVGALFPYPVMFRESRNSGAAIA